MPTFVRHMQNDYHNENGEKITHEEMFLNLDHVEFIEFRNNIYSDPMAIVYLSSGARLELLADKDNIMTGSDTKGYPS